MGLSSPESLRPEGSGIRTRVMCDNAPYPLLLCATIAVIDDNTTSGDEQHCDGTLSITVPLLLSLQSHCVSLSAWSIIERMRHQKELQRPTCDHPPIGLEP